MKFCASLSSLLLACSIASAQGFVYEQPMAPAGGVLRQSQLWVDPSGQNDLDSDAILWEDFEFQEDAAITRLRWWGQTAPPLGFQISFFHQDPNTIAVQPDLFAPGSGPISEDVYSTFTQTPAGGSMYRFDLDLVAPLPCLAHTRYFVSIVGLTPIPFAEWRWAASTSGPNGTFWWIRGAHMYMHVGESRALALATSAGWPVGTADCFGDGSSGACPCGNVGAANAGCANSTGLGAVLSAYGTANVAADSVVLTARHCPPSTMGLFFGGSSAPSPAPFGDGLRCVGGGIVRLGVVATNAAGVAASTTTISAVEGLSGGELRRYQFWYRNVLGPCGGGFNTTNALAIQW